MTHISLPAALLLAALLAPHALEAQAKPEDKVKVKVRIAPEQRPDATLTPCAIIRSSPTNLMVMRSPEFDARSHVKKAPRIDLYDYEKLTFLRSMEPAMKRMGQEQLLLEDLVRFNGKPVMLARNRRDEDVSLFYQYLDPFLTKPPPAFDPICSFPVQARVFKPSIEKPGTLTRDRFEAVAARDSSHLLIHGPHMVGPDGNAFRLLAAVDRQMRPVWQHVLRLDARAERTEVADAAIDAQGTAYLLIRYRGKGRPYWNGNSTYEAVLYRVDADDITSLSVALPDGAQPTGGVLRDFGQGVLWAGIYARPGEGSGKLEGNFVAGMQPDSTGMLPARWLPFTGEPFSEEQVSERNEAAEAAAEADEEEEDVDKKKKAEKRLDWVTDVAELLPREDGGWFIVNEAGFVTARIDGETRRARRTFYHGPVLARSFDKEWNQQWSTLYRRWAMAASPVTGRLQAAAFGPQLYLFLIDSDEMAEKRKLKERITPSTSGSPQTVYAYFDEKGGFRTKAVLKGDSARDFIGGALVRTGKDQYAAFGADGLGGARYLPVRIDLSKEVKK